MKTLNITFVILRTPSRYLRVYNSRFSTTTVTRNIQGNSNHTTTQKFQRDNNTETKSHSPDEILPGPGCSIPSETNHSILNHDPREPTHSNGADPSPPLFISRRPAAKKNRRIYITGMASAERPSAVDRIPPTNTPQYPSQVVRSRRLILRLEHAIPEDQRPSLVVICDDVNKLLRAGDVPGSIKVSSCHFLPGDKALVLVTPFTCSAYDLGDHFNIFRTAIQKWAGRKVSMSPISQETQKLYRVVVQNCPNRPPGGNRRYNHAELTEELMAQNGLPNINSQPFNLHWLYSADLKDKSFVVGFSDKSVAERLFVHGVKMFGHVLKCRPFFTEKNDPGRVGKMSTNLPI